jgi:2-isopropylmalate synthase
MADDRAASLLYDWNRADAVSPLAGKKVVLFDETLRDGIQSPSVVDPRIEDKIRLVHLMAEIGIGAVDIGLPGAGARAAEDVLALAREIAQARLPLQAACAARTMRCDLVPIVEVSEKTGLPIQVMCFIGSSPIRHYAEDWDLDFVLRRSAEAIDFAVSHGLPCVYVTEDTTRSRPAILDRLFRNAVNHGATGLCLCDTVGHATPDGIRHLIRFTRDLIAGMGARVSIDWHGHNDRGLGVPNALHAIEHGADRVHGTALGIGERVGNTSMDQLIVNLALLGVLEHQDLSRLGSYCKLASKATRFPIPASYPLAGRDAFRTASAVHAAALRKARAAGDPWLADRIFSGVPAGAFGVEPEIEIGPCSGESNAIEWLERRSIPYDAGLVAAILDAASAWARVLTEDEVREVVRIYRASARSAAAT